jgi:hypothetical protein
MICIDQLQGCLIFLSTNQTEIIPADEEKYVRELSAHENEQYSMKSIMKMTDLPRCDTPDTEILIMTFARMLSNRCYPNASIDISALRQRLFFEIRHQSIGISG